MMSRDPFLGEDARVLRADAFEFILTNELKRALRSQSFLTLLTFEPAAAAEIEGAPIAQDVVRLIGNEVRETDLLSLAASRVSVVLLDADLQSAMRVVDRLLARFEHYEFGRQVSIDVGAACCPTHGADVASLRRAADVQQLPQRDARGNASGAQ